MAPVKTKENFYINEKEEYKEFYLDIVFDNVKHTIKKKLKELINVKVEKGDTSSNAVIQGLGKLLKIDNLNEQLDNKNRLVLSEINERIEELSDEQLGYFDVDKNNNIVFYENKKKQVAIELAESYRKWLKEGLENWHKGSIINDGKDMDKKRKQVSIKLAVLLSARLIDTDQKELNKLDNKEKVIEYFAEKLGNKDSSKSRLDLENIDFEKKFQELGERDLMYIVQRIPSKFFTDYVNSHWMNCSVKNERIYKCRFQKFNIKMCPQLEVINLGLHDVPFGVDSDKNIIYDPLTDTYTKSIFGMIKSFFVKKPQLKVAMATHRDLTVVEDEYKKNNKAKYQILKDISIKNENNIIKGNEFIEENGNNSIDSINGIVHSINKDNKSKEENSDNNNYQNSSNDNFEKSISNVNNVVKESEKLSSSKTQVNKPKESPFLADKSSRRRILEAYMNYKGLKVKDETVFEQAISTSVYSSNRMNELEKSGGDEYKIAQKCNKINGNIVQAFIELYFYDNYIVRKDKEQYLPEELKKDYNVQYQFSGTGENRQFKFTINYKNKEILDLDYYLGDRNNLADKESFLRATQLIKAGESEESLLDVIKKVDFDMDMLGMEKREEKDSDIENHQNVSKNATSKIEDNRDENVNSELEQMDKKGEVSMQNKVLVEFLANPNIKERILDAYMAANGLEISDKEKYDKVINNVDDANVLSELANAYIEMYFRDSYKRDSQKSYLDDELSKKFILKFIIASPNNEDFAVKIRFIRATDQKQLFDFNIVNENNNERIDWDKAERATRIINKNDNYNNLYKKIKNGLKVDIARLGLRKKDERIINQSENEFNGQVKKDGKKDIEKIEEIEGIEGINNITNNYNNGNGNTTVYNNWEGLSSFKESKKEEEEELQIVKESKNIGLEYLDEYYDESNYNDKKSNDNNGGKKAKKEAKKFYTVEKMSLIFDSYCKWKGYRYVFNSEDVKKRWLLVNKYFLLKLLVEMKKNNVNEPKELENLKVNIRARCFATKDGLQSTLKSGGGIDLAIVVSDKNERGGHISIYLTSQQEADENKKANKKNGYKHNDQYNEYYNNEQMYREYNILMGEEQFNNSLNAYLAEKQRNIVNTYLNNGEETWETELGDKLVGVPKEMVSPFFNMQAEYKKESELLRKPDGYQIGVYKKKFNVKDAIEDFDNAEGLLKMTVKNKVGDATIPIVKAKLMVEKGAIPASKGQWEKQKESLKIEMGNETQGTKLKDFLKENENEFFKAGYGKLDDEEIDLLKDYSDKFKKLIDNLDYLDDEQIFENIVKPLLISAHALDDTDFCDDDKEYMQRELYDYLEIFAKKIGYDLDDYETQQGLIKARREEGDAVSVGKHYKSLIEGMFQAKLGIEKLKDIDASGKYDLNKILDYNNEKNPVLFTAKVDGGPHTTLLNIKREGKDIKIEGFSDDFFKKGSHNYNEYLKKIEETFNIKNVELTIEDIHNEGLSCACASMLLYKQQIGGNVREKLQYQNVYSEKYGGIITGNFEFGKGMKMSK